MGNSHLEQETLPSLPDLVQAGRPPPSEGTSCAGLERSGLVGGIHCERDAIQAMGVPHEARNQLGSQAFPVVHRMHSGMGLGDMTWPILQVASLSLAFP